MSNYYKCKACGFLFPQDEAGVLHTSHESIIGLSGSYTPLSLAICPRCSDDELEEIYISHCTSCEEPILDKEYEFFGEYYCLDCLMDIIPDSKQLLEDYIKDSCSFFLKRFHDYTKIKDTKEIILTLADEDSLFIEDYLLFLEERVENFKNEDIKDLDYHTYSKLCADCPCAKRCHEDCTNCEDYEELLNYFESLEELSKLS